MIERALMEQNHPFFRDLDLDEILEDDDNYQPPRERHRRRPNLPVQDRILNVLEYMNEQGFLNLRNFIEEMFTCEDEIVKRRVARFYHNRGFERTFTALVASTRWSCQKRVSHASTRLLGEMIGGEIRRMFARVIALELEDIEDALWLRLRPTCMTEEIAGSFSMQEWHSRFSNHAPHLSSLIGLLCGVNDDGNAAADELSEHDIRSARVVYERGDRDQEIADEDEEVPYFMDEIDESEDNGRTHRRKRNKWIIATTVISQILFSRNQHSNAFQLSVRMYLQAAAAPKPIISLLNQVGVSVSYNTICKSLKTIGYSNRDTARASIKAGVQFEAEVKVDRSNWV